MPAMSDSVLNFGIGGNGGIVTALDGSGQMASIGGQSEVFTCDVSQLGDDCE